MERQMITVMFSGIPVGDVCKDYTKPHDTACPHFDLNRCKIFRNSSLINPTVGNSTSNSVFKKCMLCLEAGKGYTVGGMMLKESE